MNAKLTLTLQDQGIKKVDFQKLLMHYLSMLNQRLGNLYLCLLNWPLTTIGTLVSPLN